MSDESKKEVNLEEDEVEELQKRETLARQHQLTADAVRLQSRVFLNNILKSHGLDISKNYNVDLDTGKVEQAEEDEEK